MNDKLERFVRENRRDFDRESPSPGVWEQIDKSIPVKKEARRFSLRHLYAWTAAASIVFIALTSIYFLVIRKNSHEGSKTNDPVVAVNQDELNSIGPEYAAIFKEVYRSIGERQSELRSATAGQPELYRQFQEDLAALDSSYQALKKQAQQSVNRDLITEAMIQNLRLQAELLSRQLMISRDFNNNQKKVNHEKDI